MLVFGVSVFAKMFTAEAEELNFLNAPIPNTPRILIRIDRNNPGMIQGRYYMLINRTSRPLNGRSAIIGVSTCRC